jgi:hypothetical protein
VSVGMSLVFNTTFGFEDLASLDEGFGSIQIDLF